MSKIGALATIIYDNEIGFETGDARDVEISLVSGWLLGHLGELNTHVFTCLSGENPDNLNLEEQNILTEMYISNYYRKSQRMVLRGVDGSTSSPDWQSIREGDSMITKSNRNATAQNYHQAYLASAEKLKELIYSYNLYGAKPSQVAGKDAPISGQYANPGLNDYYN